MSLCLYPLFLSFFCCTTHTRTAQLLSLYILFFLSLSFVSLSILFLFLCFISCQSSFLLLPISLLHFILTEYTHSREKRELESEGLTHSERDTELWDDLCSPTEMGAGFWFYFFCYCKTGTERDFTSSFLLLICFSKSSINCCPKKEPENYRETEIDRRKNMQRDFLKN
jgi:hypothetical protein